MSAIPSAHTWSAFAARPCLCLHRGPLRRRSAPARARAPYHGQPPSPGAPPAAVSHGSLEEAGDFFFFLLLLRPSPIVPFSAAFSANFVVIN